MQPYIPYMNLGNINSFLEVFYQRVREDELLGPVFNNIVSNWDSHLKKVLTFWNHHLLEPGVYKGNLLKVHEKLDLELSEELFKKWLYLFEQTASEKFEGKDLHKICLKARIIGGTLFGRLNNHPLEVPGFPPADFI